MTRSFPDRLTKLDEIICNYAPRFPGGKFHLVQGGTLLLAEYIIISIISEKARKKSNFSVPAREIDCSTVSKMIISGLANFASFMSR